MTSGENYCYNCGRFYRAWYYGKPICEYFSQPIDEEGYALGKPTCKQEMIE